MEEINWNVVGNNEIRRKFVIPVGSDKKWWQFWKKDKDKEAANSDLGTISGSALPDSWIDWNTLSLDQMVEHLRRKYMFSSSGDAKCIYHLIEFYDKHK